MIPKSDEKCEFTHLLFVLHFVEDGTDRKKRKRSRWGGTENDKTFIPGMPTILPPTLDSAQQEAYLGKYNTQNVCLLCTYLIVSSIACFRITSGFKNKLTQKNNHNENSKAAKIHRSPCK